MDATKNAVSMAASAYYSHRELDHKTGAQKQEMLFAKGVNFNGYPDTFKQLFRRFYASIADASLTPDYPQMADGLRQMRILDAELASAKSRSWVDVK